MYSDTAVYMYIYIISTLHFVYVIQSKCLSLCLDETDEDVKVSRHRFSDDEALPLSTNKHTHTHTNALTATHPCTCASQQTSCPTSPCSQCCRHVYECGLPLHGLLIPGQPITGQPLTLQPFARYNHDAALRDRHSTVSTSRLQPSAPLMDEGLTGRASCLFEEPEGPPPANCEQSGEGGAQSMSLVFTHCHSLGCNDDVFARHSPGCSEQIISHNSVLANTYAAFGRPTKPPLTNKHVTNVSDMNVAQDDVIFANRLPQFACHCAAQFRSAHTPVHVSDCVEGVGESGAGGTDTQWCVVCSGLQPPRYESIDK